MRSKKVGATDGTVATRRQLEQRKPQYRNRPRMSRGKLRNRIGRALIRAISTTSSQEEQAAWITLNHVLRAFVDVKYGGSQS